MSGVLWRRFKEIYPKVSFSTASQHPGKPIYYGGSFTLYEEFFFSKGGKQL